MKQGNAKLGELIPTAQFGRPHDRGFGPPSGVNNSIDCGAGTTINKERSQTVRTAQRIVTVPSGHPPYTGRLQRLDPTCPHHCHYRNTCNGRSTCQPFHCICSSKFLQFQTLRFVRSPPSLKLVLEQESKMHSKNHYCYPERDIFGIIIVS